MFKFQKVLTFLIFFFSILENIYSAPTFGWEIFQNTSYLYINQNSVFDTRDKFKNIPSNVQSENISTYSFYIGEYFILRNDKENFGNLISALKSEKSNDSIAQILNIFSKIENDAEQEANTKIDEMISKEDNQILISLLKTLKLNLKKKTSSDEQKESIKQLSCNRGKLYYQFCKVLKLKVQIEAIADNSDYLHRDYLNLDRVLAPFFEESELNQVYFLDKIIPEIGSKLAYLGFAYEAAFFQKNILNLQKVAGIYYSQTSEKLAYYYMLSDDLISAEESMNYILKKNLLQNGTRNSILLKLAAIASFRKDYKQALLYYLELNFKNWNSEERNPFFQDSLSQNQAKELIALAIWKSKSGVAAVKALNKLQSDQSITEENLSMKLRIAQIIMSDKPEVAEKMTDDILYSAQSKAFKRIEYAATNLNGYCNILTKKYRKSSIQFTKSYGILGDSDPVFSSEWMRNSGTLFAKILGGERGNHSSGLKYLLSAMKIEEPLDEVLSVKNYIDSRFDTESFYKLAVNHFVNTKNYSALLETLYSYQRMKSKPFGIYNKTVLQIPDVNRRIKYYRGLRPISENFYYKSDYSKFRESEANKLMNDSDKFDSNIFREIRDPMISAFSFNEKIYVISYDNKNSKWNLSIHNSIEYRTSIYYEKVFANLSFLDKTNQVQVFLNPIGIDLFHAFRKSNPLLFTRLFYSFQKGNLKKQENELTSFAISSDSNSETTNLNGINLFGTDYFEGSKFFQVEERLHIWNVRDSYSKDSFFENYEWKVQSNSINFQKIFRRADLRTIPYSILIDRNIFQRMSFDSMSIDYYFWADFWMRKGVRNLYYIDKLESEKFSLQDTSNILTKQNNTSEDFYKIQSIYKTASKEILILTKELK